MLFDQFLQSASERLAATARTIGPGAPAVATMTTSSEVHVQRAPRSFFAMQREMLPAYRRRELQHADGVLERVLDNAAQELPDGSRLFICFASALAVALNEEDRVVRGFLAATPLKISRGLRSSAFRDVVEELCRRATTTTACSSSPSSQNSKLAACSSVAACDCGSAPIMTSVASTLALNLGSAASSFSSCAKDVASRIIELSGLSITNSRVLAPGIAVLPVASIAHRSALQECAHAGVKRILLVKRFDFLPFGANASDDSSDSSDSDSSYGNDGDQEQQHFSDWQEAAAFREHAKWTKKNRGTGYSFSEIVEPYRESVELSSAGLSRMIWLDRFRKVLEKFSSSLSPSESPQLLILTSQKLPEAALAPNLCPRVRIVDAVDSHTLRLFEQAAGKRIRAAVIPLSPDELDTRSSFVSVVERLVEVQLPVQQQHAAAFFEFAIAVDESTEEEEEAPRCALACGPSLTVARDLKKLTTKLVRCLSRCDASLSSSSCRGGFAPLLEFGRLAAATSAARTDAADDLSPCLLKCASIAARQVVMSILLAPMQQPNRRRSADQLQFLKRPESADSLSWSVDDGAWKLRTTSTVDDVAVADFSWVLSEVVSCAIEFVAMLLAVDGEPRRVLA